MTKEEIYDEALRTSVHGTLAEFEVAVTAHLGRTPATPMEKLKRLWAESDVNPYNKKEKPVKAFLVTFQRLGTLRDYPIPVKATEVAACEKPIKDFVETVLEQQNVIVTIIDGKGQLNYGLLGEFTIQPM